MKKHLLLTVFTLSLVTPIYSQGSWSPKANLGPSSTYGRSKAACFEINGLGYVGTGYNGTSKVDVWAYDPTTNVWTQKANFGGAARYGAFGFAVNGDGYIGCGYVTPTYVKDMWKYDVTGNSWSQVTDFGGSGRMDATSFVIGNRAYVGTGYTGSTMLKDFWQYNPSADSWLQKANYGGSSCSNATGFAVSGKGYVCLGGSTSTYFDDVFEYDTTANTWTAKTKFPGAAREGAKAFVIGSKAYVGTGGSNSLATLHNDFYKFDPAGNTWTQVANFTGSLRSHAASFAIGKYGYLGTGYTGGQVNSFYQYDPCSLTYTFTPTSLSCNADSSGSVSISISGATSPLTYLWSNAASTQTISGLAAGTYSVLVTDADGCTTSDSLILTEPSVLNDTIVPMNIPCTNDSTGTIYISGLGGTTPYSYAWSNASTSQNISGLTAGTYSVVLTDANGCTMVDSATIIQPLTALTQSITITTASCPTCPDGAATSNTTGGNTPYTYLWTPSSQTTQTITGLLIGQYTVCVTDSNNCVRCDTLSIGINNSVIEYNSPKISIFPNPSSGTFKISGVDEKVNIFVFNLIGKLVFETKMAKNEENIVLEKFPEGIYTMYLKTEKKIYTKKITIIK